MTHATAARRPKTALRRAKFVGWRTCSKSRQNHARQAGPQPWIEFGEFLVVCMQHSIRIVKTRLCAVEAYVGAWLASSKVQINGAHVDAYCGPPSTALTNQLPGPEMCWAYSSLRPEDITPSRLRGQPASSVLIPRGFHDGLHKKSAVWTVGLVAARQKSRLLVERAHRDIAPASTLI